ncbi:MAG: HAD family phosphatase [Raineya sp.]
MNILENIEAIIFDLGGVIINIDFNLTLQALEKYTHKRIGRGEYLSKHPIFYEFETGKLSENEFFEKLKDAYELTASKEELIEAWNTLLLDIPIERVELISSLSERYATFILSNTNPTHLIEVENILNRQTRVKSLSNLVHKPYYSFDMGKAKPEAAIYQEVMQENKLIAHKTLFIDDSQANIEAAKALGLQTLLIRPSHNSILDFLHT